MWVLSDVRSAQGVIEDALAASTSTGGDEGSLAALRVSHATERADLHTSLAVTEEKLANAERHIQKFEHNNDTLDGLAIKVHEVEDKMKIFEVKGSFLEENVSEEINN